MRRSVNYNVPVYNPSKDRGANHFHPANLESRLLVEIAHTYDDIVQLVEILDSLSDKHKRLCILKHMVLDWLSLDPHLLKLSGMIIGGSCQYPVANDDIENIKDLKKNYHSLREKYFPKLVQTRNKVIAHKDLEEVPSLHDVSQLLDNLNAATIIDIINKIPPLVNAIQSLPIFAWYKQEGEIMAFVQPFNISLAAQQRME